MPNDDLPLDLEGWEHYPSHEDGYCFSCDCNPCICYDPMLDWEDPDD